MWLHISNMPCQDLHGNLPACHPWSVRLAMPYLENLWTADQQPAYISLKHLVMKLPILLL